LHEKASEQICYARAVSKQTASQHPSISIVGPGNFGSTLALVLSKAGHRIQMIAVRPGSKRMRQARALSGRIGARLIVAASQPLEGHVIWIAVPDDKIARVAQELASSGKWKGKLVFHSSGALTSDELAALRVKGARVASVHPMMTFARGEVPPMAGVAFALEGDAAAVRAARSIVRTLGGNPFVIQKQDKRLYHVFGSFASPLVIALMATMEEVALAAGIRRRDITPIMAPLLQQTLRNYLKHNAAAAFSGPLARGDVATLRKHLIALRGLPRVKKLYLALGNAALQNLPVKNKANLAKALRKGSKH
jgi:predicted short-subunit dehydrogenase-like oxidoreductase (DUF2520 family)